MALIGCAGTPVADSASENPSDAAETSERKAQPTAEQAAAPTTADADCVPAAVLPGDLANLPKIEATPWVQVCDDPACEGLEGPAYAKDGTIYVCHIPHGDTPPGIFKVSADGTVEPFYELQGPPAVTIAIHKDGRIFAGVVNGNILVLDAGGNLLETIAPALDGVTPHIDDMVFDSKGNLYLTNFAGNVTDAAGTVWRLEAADNYATVTPILKNLAGPNGVSLSEDDATMWVSESTGARILRVGLNEEGLAEGRTPDSGVHPVYMSTGMNGPDSNKTDAENNLYQCMFGTGRAVILNDRGIPTTNLVIKGSEKGEMLLTTNVAIEPGTTEGIMVAGGTTGGWICQFEALNPGTRLFSHR